MEVPSMKTASLVEGFDLDGSSPPGVFVGRAGYPKVAIGPLLPPSHGDTTLLDTPEKWLGKTQEDIVSFRSQLVRGKHTVDIHDVEGGGKLVELTREMALAKKSPDVEASFSKRPSGRIFLDDEVQPYGPSAPLSRMNVDSLKVDRKLEKAFYDTDLKAADAVGILHDKGVMTSGIQRAFSVGAFGLGANRRFVPTRWSITAVDDVVSKHVVEEVKGNPTIDDYRVHEAVSLDNLFIVILFPAAWGYEMMEAWYPGTVWNPGGTRVNVYASSEGYRGRSKYAEIGGAYYAGRLAITDHMREIRRQATAVVLREIREGYTIPVGVWNIREGIRDALAAKPVVFDSQNIAVEYAFTRLRVPRESWISKSRILQDRFYQKRMEDFL
jgi:hypothetical protein